MLYEIFIDFQLRFPSGMSCLPAIWAAFWHGVCRHNDTLEERFHLVSQHWNQSCRAVADEPNTSTIRTEFVGGKTRLHVKGNVINTRLKEVENTANITKCWATCHWPCEVVLHVYGKSRREDTGLHNTLMHCRHSRIPTGKSRTQPFSGFVWSFISWSANYGGARHCTCQHIHREAVNVIQRHQVQTPETCEIALWRSSSFFWNHKKSWKLSLQDTYLSKHNLDMLAEAHITFLATQSWSDAKCTHCEVLMSQGHLVWHVSLYVRSWANRASRLLKSLKIISQIIKYIEHHILFHHWNMLKVC